MIKFFVVFPCHLKHPHISSCNFSSPRLHLSMLQSTRGIVANVLKPYSSDSSSFLLVVDPRTSVPDGFGYFCILLSCFCLNASICTLNVLLEAHLMSEEISHILTCLFCVCRWWSSPGTTINVTLGERMNFDLWPGMDTLGICLVSEVIILHQRLLFSSACIRSSFMETKSISGSASICLFHWMSKMLCH